jgi:hypothetical protein
MYSVLTHSAVVVAVVVAAVAAVAAVTHVPEISLLASIIGPST